MGEKQGDIVYTPAWCAKDMVDFFAPKGKILEPCVGEGAFLSLLPSGSLWCEIELGRDFFSWTKPVDWIITNPPYSMTRKFLVHALSLSENVCFLVPARNIFSGYGTVLEGPRAGFGMKHIRWYGTGGSLGFPMGNAISAIHWEKGYAGPIFQSFYGEQLR